MINLTKGQNVSLTKGIKKISVGLSWDIANTGDKDMDLDVIAIALDDKNGNAINDEYCVFYNSIKKTSDGKPCDPEQAIIHSGDNRTGSGEGDDETINIDFSKLNPRVKAIIFIINIYQGKENNQNFGQVKNPRARVYEDGSTTPSIVYELDEDFSTQTTVEFVRAYNHNGEWKVDAVGTANENDLISEFAKYGVPATGNA